MLKYKKNRSIYGIDLSDLEYELIKDQLLPKEELRNIQTNIYWTQYLLRSVGETCLKVRWKHFTHRRWKISGIFEKLYNFLRERFKSSLDKLDVGIVDQLK